MNGIKITPADKYFSWCVRERSDWTCEKCGTRYTPPTTGLQCAHIYGRRNKAVRLDPLNAFSLCAACHQYFTANPMHFATFVKMRLNGSLEILNEKSNNIVLGKEVHAAIKSGEAAKHYREEYERMREMRLNGKTGRIEFVGYL